MKEVKEDCFAYNEERKGCNALKHLYCKTEICKFYKTKEQFRKEKEAWEHEGY